MLYSILVTIDVLLAIGIIGLVLIQQGKGADVGAAFGSGASGTVFGARGAASFLTHTTAILVALFFINSLALAYLASHRPVAESVIDTTQESTVVVPSVENVSDGEVQVPQVDIDETDLPDLPEAGGSDPTTATTQELDSMESMDSSADNALDDVPE